MQCVIGQDEVNLVDILGEGGEARVYRHRDWAVKIWKKPNDPSILDCERKAFADRVAILPIKLAAFPKEHPRGVVCPQELVYTTKGRQVIGYAMPLTAGASLRKWSEGRPTWDTQKRVLMDLWYVVKGMHDYNIVWGDANDLNVLVNGTEVNVIDADSLQFGRFRCTTFTQRFGDPRLMSGGQLTQPHDEGSDWYAWSLMAFISMTGISPWDGTPIKDRVGITPCWATAIKTPKWSVPYWNLGTVAKEVFRNIFVTPMREVPDVRIFEEARRDCGACGKWVWDRKCVCGETQTVTTSGAYANSKGKYVKVWMHGGILCTTEVINGGRIVTGPQPALQLADLYDDEEQTTYIGDDQAFIRHGAVYVGPKRIGTVIKNRTRIWGGKYFGLGLSQLLDSWTPLIFDRGILDGLEIPAIRGRLYNVQGYTSETFGWFGLDSGASKKLVAFTRQGKYCSEIKDPDTIDGCVAHLNYLFVPGEDCLTRYDVNGNKRVFDGIPITTKHKLLIHPLQGLMAWNEKEIRHIKVS